MSKRTRLIIIIAVVVAVCAGLYFLFRGSHPGMSGSSSSYAEFNNIDLQETKDGKLVWRLKIKHAKSTPDRNHVQMEGIEGYFKKDDTELQLTAPSGTIDRTKRLLVLNGNVECTSKDGLDFYGKDLKYDGKKEVLTSSEPFTAYRDGKVLTGDSLEADRVMQKIKAIGHAVLQDQEKENTK